jgi:hypothetical protein
MPEKNFHRPRLKKTYVNRINNNHAINQNPSGIWWSGFKRKEDEFNGRLNSEFYKR